MKKFLIKKIENEGGYKKLFFHSAMALTFTSGLSYVFGLIRDRTLAQTFGIGRDLDVYYAAFVLPDIILAIFVTACVSAVLVPMFLEKSSRNAQEAREYFYNILSVILIVIITLAIIIAVFIPYFAEYLVGGFDASQKELYVLLVRIMVLSPIIFALSNFFGGILISTKDFFFYGIAPVFYNIGIIIGVVFFVPEHGVVWVAWGTILGAVLHLGSRLFVGIKRIGPPAGIRKFIYWNGATSKTFYLMLPKIFQIGAWQLLLAWFVFLATNMGEGSVSVYSFARNFQSMPVSLIGIAVALSAFSTLSQTAVKKDIGKFKRIVNQKIKLILILTVLSAIALAIGGKFLVMILFVGKGFDLEAVSRISILLAVYSVSIPLESVMHLLARVHYALQETLRPALIHIFSIGVTIAVGWLGRHYGIIIIPISFTIGLLLQNTLLMISYKQLLALKMKK